MVKKTRMIVNSVKKSFPKKNGKEITIIPSENFW